MNDGIARTDNPYEDKRGGSYSEKYSESSILTLEYVLDSFQNSWLLMEYFGKNS